MTLQGIFPAMITPFDDAGAVDTAGIRSMVEFLLGARVHGLHPCGTTGEAPLLSIDERKLVAETVLEATAGRVPVIIQVGHLLTSEAVKLARHAAAAGADAISVVTPYYYALPESALLSYFGAVADAVPSDFPVYLYNIPQCTANPVSASLLATVMRLHGNVVGIKHSQTDLDWLAAFLRATDGRASVFVGSDTVALPGLALGAAGVVSGNANAFPEPFVRLYDAVAADDWTGARRLQDQITTIAGLLGNGGSLASFKAVAAARGVALSSAVREPLAPLAEETSQRVREALRFAREAGVC